MSAGVTNINLLDIHSRKEGNERGGGRGGHADVEISAGRSRGKAVSSGSSKKIHFLGRYLLESAKPNDVISFSDKNP